MGAIAGIKGTQLVPTMPQLHLTHLQGILCLVLFVFPQDTQTTHSAAV